MNKDTIATVGKNTHNERMDQLRKFKEDYEHSEDTVSSDISIACPETDVFMKIHEQPQPVGQ